MSRKKYKILAIFFLLAAHLLLVIYLKYSTNNLDINLFRLDYFGNIFNIVFSLLIIGGYLYTVVNSKTDQTKDATLILIITFLTFVPLLFIFISGDAEVLFGSVFIFSLPVVKILNGILSFVEIFLQFFLLFVIWLFAVDRSERAYVRSTYLSLASIFLLFLFAFFFTMVDNDNTINSINDEEGIAVIMGAAVWSRDKPSPIFEGRIKKAYDLYNSGYVDKIQLTGGNAPGEISEAETAFNYLKSLGVKSEDVIIESRTSTTNQQIQFIKSNLVERFDYKNIIIISDNFHMSRILEICKFYRIDAVGSTSDHEVRWTRLLFYRIRESTALIMFWFFAI
ncbi:YdcF family protein [Bacteroidota bacterium]